MRNRENSGRGTVFEFKKHEIILTRGDVSYILEVSGSYSTGYDPPPCSDHDHPAFSDPGSDPEFEITEAVVRGYDELDSLDLKSVIDTGQQIDLTPEEELIILGRLNFEEV